MTDKNDTLAMALCRAQSIMTAAKKDKANPFFKSKYADLSSVIEAINYPLTSNDLSYSQLIDVLESGRMVLITKLMHKNGESLDSKMLLPDIVDPQKIGSAITYYRRYSLMSISGLPAEDDDGNSASKETQYQQLKDAETIIDEKTFVSLDEYLNGHDELRSQIKKLCKVDDLANIKKSQIEAVRKYARNYKDKIEKSNESASSCVD